MTYRVLRNFRLVQKFDVFISWRFKTRFYINENMNDCLIEHVQLWLYTRTDHKRKLNTAKFLLKCCDRNNKNMQQQNFTYCAW